METRADDAFWAARRVAAFTDELIRAAVHTGEFSDPAAEKYLGDVLIKRRNKVTSLYLTAVNPIVSPRLDPDGRLTIENAAFAAGVSGERNVRRATWEARDVVLRFEVEANAFLRGMVRGIVGTLLWVGRGKISAVRFEEILEARDRAQAGPSAPAQGLCLTLVSYGDKRSSQHGESGESGESENDE
jgi:hypothetical protein